MPAAMNREQRLAEADRLLDEKGQSLTKWLVSQKLEYADELRRYNWQNNVVKPLVAQGKFTAAEAWIESQAHDLAEIWKASPRLKVCKEIANRFVVAWMKTYTAKHETRAKVVVDEAEDGEWKNALPKDIYWVKEHPGLFGPESDPERQVAAAEYEKKNPAPMQSAVTLYKMCREDPDYAKDFFKNAAKLFSDHRKRSKESTVSEVDKKAQQQVLDMKAELKKLAKKDASATIPA